MNIDLTHEQQQNTARQFTANKIRLNIKHQANNWWACSLAIMLRFERKSLNIF